MLSDYFTFYNIPISFKIDAAALKKTYYANSKKYHPDFHTLEDDGSQEQVLQLSTHNNKAYQTLTDFDQRMEYILRLKNVLDEEGQNKIPQDFLLEMMDINEGLMDIQMDPDPSKLAELNNQLDQMEVAIMNPIKDILSTYDGSNKTDLSLVKEYYLKKKYLKRIKDRIENQDVDI